MTSLQYCNDDVIMKLTSNLIGHLGPSHSASTHLTFEPTKFKLAVGASLSSKVKGWTVRGYKARAYNQHSHFDFSSGCFKSLQTGLDHSYVHTKQISILWY